MENIENMRHNPNYQSPTAVLLATILLFALGCATPARNSSSATGPIPRTHSDAPLIADQTTNMAADDAEAFRAAPARREPSRRPPDPRTRRRVDQPRIRP